MAPADNLAEARRSVEDEAEGRTIDWQVGKLPQVMGDAATLQHGLINLLSNAVKFTRPRVQAVIQIGARRNALETTVWVRDNRVGFDSAYGDKLFGPFQRLHPQKEFEGTGIGLATSRRTMMRTRAVSGPRASGMRAPRCHSRCRTSARPG